MTDDPWDEVLRESRATFQALMDGMKLRRDEARADEPRLLDIERNLRARRDRAAEAGDRREYRRLCVLLDMADKAWAANREVADHPITGEPENHATSEHSVEV